MGMWVSGTGAEMMGTYTQTVTHVIKNRPPDYIKSYLRGALKVKGSKKVTTVLEKLLEKTNGNTKLHNKS